MRNRLIAIFVCVLLANVVNYALGEWLDSALIGRVTNTVTDGSTLVSSIKSDQSATEALPSPAEQTTVSFYQWLGSGGADNYAAWRSGLENRDAATDPFLQRALDVMDNTNASRFAALLLLVVTLLLLWGKAFKESSWLTPFLYFGITLGTTALYGSLSAPFYTGVVVGTYSIYFLSIRLFLPVFHTEWCRMLRPFLTLQLFVLATMAFRGPELVDYWFWTSPLFRLGLTLVTLLSVSFHLTIVMKVLAKGNMDTIARYFGFGMPLGFTLIVLGLVLGFYGPEAGAAVQQINYELVTLPTEIVAGINPEAPFLLSGAGVLLAVVSGIGYFVQRIAR